MQMPDFHNLILLLLALLFFQCEKMEGSLVNARLLRARIVNYDQPQYPTEAPWLEYIVSVENTGIHPIAFLSETGQITLRSWNGTFTDTLQVFGGFRFMCPREIDTIRIIDYFLEKGDDPDPMNWINPEAMKYSCLLNDTLPSDGQLPGCVQQDSVIHVESFVIRKSSSFSYAIE